MMVVLKTSARKQKIDMARQSNDSTSSVDLLGLLPCFISHLLKKGRQAPVHQGQPMLMQSDACHAMGIVMARSQCP